jgi:hypothetical protein
MCLGLGRKFTGRGRAECYMDVFEALKYWEKYLSVFFKGLRGWRRGGGGAEEPIWPALPRLL